MAAGQLGKRENWRQMSRPSVTPTWSRRASDVTERAQQPHLWTMRNRSRRPARRSCPGRTGSTNGGTGSPGQNVQFGIAIGPEHQYTSLSCPCRVARRGDRIGRAFIPAAPHARAEFCSDRVVWLREGADRYAGLLILTLAPVIRARANLVPAKPQRRQSRRRFGNMRETTERGRDAGGT